jgi:hypothetical protein
MPICLPSGISLSLGFPKVSGPRENRASTTS